jgi:hypothetical protein
VSIPFVSNWVPGLATPADKLKIDKVPTLETGLTAAAAAAAAALKQGTHTLWLPGIGLVGRTSASPVYNAAETATQRVMMAGYDFDPSTPQYAQAMIGMPKSWDGGTLQAQFCWTALSGAGDVRWGIQAVAIGDGQSLDAAWQPAVTVTDSLIAVGAVHLTATAAAFSPGAVPAMGLLAIQIYRDAAAAADTLSASARLLGVRLFCGIAAGTDA